MRARSRVAADDYSVQGRSASRYERPSSRRQASVPRSARRSSPSHRAERFPLGCDPGVEYKEQEYLKEQKMKLTDEIGGLLQEIRPLRKKLREKEAQYLDKNDIDRIYFEQFGDSQTNQIIEQREKSSQIVRLQRQCDDVTDEYEDLRSLCSQAALHQLAIEVHHARKELFQMKEDYYVGAKKLDRIVRKIEILKMSDCYDGVQEQRERINDIKRALKTHIERYEKLREKSKRYVVDIHKLRQDNQHRPDVVRKREDTSKIKKLEAILLEKREILAATQAKYRRLLENNVDAAQSPLQMYRQSTPIQRKVSPPVIRSRKVGFDDPDDESFSEPFVQELVVAVGLFRRAVTENEVRSMFSKFGAINGLRVFPKHGTSPQAYFAKIAFYDHDVAERAIEKMNGRFFEDHALNVKWARDQAFCASLTRGTARKGMFSEFSSESRTARQEKIQKRITKEKARTETKSPKQEKKKPPPVLLSESSSNSGYNDSPARIEPLEVGSSDSSSSSLDLDPESGEVKVIQKPKSDASRSSERVRDRKLESSGAEKIKEKGRQSSASVSEKGSTAQKKRSMESSSHSKRSSVASKNFDSIKSEKQLSSSASKTDKSRTRSSAARSKPASRHDVSDKSQSSSQKRVTRDMPSEKSSGISAKQTESPAPPAENKIDHLSSSSSFVDIASSDKKSEGRNSMFVEKESESRNGQSEEQTNKAKPRETVVTQDTRSSSSDSGAFDGFHESNSKPENEKGAPTSSAEKEDQIPKPIMGRLLDRFTTNITAGNEAENREPEAQKMLSSSSRQSRNAVTPAEEVHVNPVNSDHDIEHRDRTSEVAEPAKVSESSSSFVDVVEVDSSSSSDSEKPQSGSQKPEFEANEGKDKEKESASKSSDDIVTVESSSKSSEAEKPATDNHSNALSTHSVAESSSSSSDTNDAPHDKVNSDETPKISENPSQAEKELVLPTPDLKLAQPQTTETDNKSNEVPMKSQSSSSSVDVVESLSSSDEKLEPPAPETETNAPMTRQSETNDNSQNENIEAHTESRSQNEPQTHENIPDAPSHGSSSSSVKVERDHKEPDHEQAPAENHQASGEDNPLRLFNDLGPDPLQSVPRKPMLFGRLLKGIGDTPPSTPLDAPPSTPQDEPPSTPQDEPPSTPQDEPPTAQVAPELPPKQEEVMNNNDSSDSDGVIEINVSDDDAPKQEDSVAVEIPDSSSSDKEIASGSESSDSNDF